MLVVMVGSLGSCSAEGDPVNWPYDGLWMLSLVVLEFFVINFWSFFKEFEMESSEA